MEKPDKLNLDFSTSPTVWRFLKDDSFVRGLIGPVGSGKSYASCAEVFKRAVQQKPPQEMALDIPGLLWSETLTLC